MARVHGSPKMTPVFTGRVGKKEGLQNPTLEVVTRRFLLVLLVYTFQFRSRLKTDLIYPYLKVCLKDYLFAKHKPYEIAYFRG